MYLLLLSRVALRKLRLLQVATLFNVVVSLARVVVSLAI